MIKKLTEIKQKANETKRLKSELKEIYKHYIAAKKLNKPTKKYKPTGEFYYVKDFKSSVDELTNVFLELHAFEQANTNNIGYTTQINNAVFNLYHKIDYQKLKLMEYKWPFYYKQFN